ncbi:Crp/Fnr family transcriptional regulator [Salipiger bermudensis]|uniref:Crp/Fnr family transcriptional regulator n=1 Tax=Salipiger bermudensis TaxID=344736 RepID=UPI001C99E030|nr:Crp/Fnr family transcriptional regulator [Salipiger bermudensis]MBY6006208.1 Crp/Fnr family transcriptional regulator [Salipiger bermudensis]
MRSCFAQLDDRGRDALLSRGWLAARTSEFQEAFLALGSLRTVHEGRYLYRVGDPMERAFGLVDGRIDILLPVDSLPDAAFPVCGPGHWHGLSSLVDRTRAISSARVLRTSTICCISRRDFIAFLEANPRRYRDILAYEHELRAFLQEFLAEALSCGGPILVARQILRMMDAGRTDALGQLPVSQALLARLMGVSDATLQRALKDLRADGIVDTLYGKIRIIDRDALLARASEEPRVVGHS